MKKNKTLPPIKHNKSIENLLKNNLNRYITLMVNSYNYWLLAKINKFKNGEIKNINGVLKTEFNKLDKRWGENLDKFAYKLVNKLNNSINQYVDNKLLNFNKDYRLKTKSQLVKNSLYASMNEQLSLIKSVPLELKNKYEVIFYNAVSNFDLEAITNQLKELKIITNKRIKTIARDQVSKAIESYTEARIQQLGFDYYVWATSKDERVSTGRGGHKYLDGRIYKYDNPTAIIDSKGNIGHPARRVNCRCVSLALILKENEGLKKIKDNKHGDYYVIINK